MRDFQVCTDRHIGYSPNSCRSWSGAVQAAFFIFSSFGVLGFGRQRTKISAGVRPGATRPCDLAILALCLDGNGASLHSHRLNSHRLKASAERDAAGGYPGDATGRCQAMGRGSGHAEMTPLAASPVEGSSCALHPTVTRHPDLRGPRGLPGQVSYDALILA